MECPRFHILLVDDHVLFCESIARALSTEFGFEVTYCGSIAEALQIVERSAIDVVLLDYDLGFERGSRFLPEARRSGFSGPVLVVTAWVSGQEARRLIRQGAAGIFLKENSLGALAEAIRAVAQGGAWLDQQYLKLAVGADERHAEGKLSERDRQLLRYLLDGLTNKEIAARLLVSETSVKTLLQRLFQKTGVHTRGQLVRVALEQHQDLL